MSTEPQKKRRGRPRSVDPTQVVDVALHTWWAEGLHAVSINALCKKASLSKPLLYREFGREDGLMVAVLQRYREVAIRPLLGVLAQDVPAREGLQRLVRVLTTDRGVPMGCLFTKMRLDRPRLGPLAEAMVDEVVAERLDGFAAWVRRGQARGELVTDLTAEDGAAYIDGQITGIVVQLGAGDAPDGVRAMAERALGVLLA